MVHRSSRSRIVMATTSCSGSEANMFSGKTNSILGLISVSLGYGSLSVAARWLDGSFGIFTQVYVRIFLAMVVMFIIFPRDIRWHKIKSLNLRDWLILLLMGVVGYGLMVYAITRGALLTTLLNVSVLFSTVPIFVYLLGVIFLKRQWRYLILGLLLLSIWGVGVLSSGQIIPSLSGFGVGDWWVLASALFEAIWYLGIKLLKNKLNSREITVIAQAIASVIIFILAIKLGEPLPTISSFLSWQVVLGLLIGIIMNVLAPLITMYAFKHLDEVFATQLFLSENIFALLVGYFFYGEMISPISLLGAGIVVASVYIMNKIQQT